MDRFTSRMISCGEQQHIDQYLLRSIIMDDISCRTVNNFFFLEFAKKINSSYELLSRKKLAHEVLTQEVVYAKNRNELLLAETAHLTLNISGWSNRCRRSLYEYNVITDNRQAIVLSPFDISSCSHIAEFLVNRLEFVLARASKNINRISKIRSVDGDNSNTMGKCLNYVF